MAILIEVINLSLNINGNDILKNINFTVEEGEVVGILGKSGSGKTILMHILRGTENYSTNDISGSVLYHISKCDHCGRIDIPSKSKTTCTSCNNGFMEYYVYDFIKSSSYEEFKKSITRRISIMIQRTFALYGDENVLTNVTNALSEIGLNGKNLIKNAASILEEVNLSHRLLHIARDLSGGEKQRVVLARQLVKQPFLLLADEPTGTLDPMNADTVHKVIMNCVDKYNMALVLTSHWPQVISKLSTKAILLDNGSISLMGSPDVVIKSFINEDNFEEKNILNKKLNQFGSSLIKVENITKKYISVDRGVVKAVNDVSFEVFEKEIFGIVGVSGSGKTSISKIIMGLIPPTSGNINVRIGDEWIDMKKLGFNNKGRATRYMGLLHQEYSLYPSNSIIGNLTESISLDLPYELGIRKAIKTLLIAGFSQEKAESILDKKAEELSEGERHRVAMAQVLMKEPSIVIMDEPTGTMDPITKKSVAKSILNARNDLGETFIIVSHDLDFVQDICDRVILMEYGKKVYIGDPLDALKYLENLNACK